ncbi:hypothetical protein WK92_10605 [Burkholderia ubonensis]|nr:hypothetical protein WK82_02540 [Burkholderia ubonensis]KVW23815.1 hypothetical protein WK92_10605 [Burkholderia ubonensis]
MVEVVPAFTELPVAALDTETVTRPAVGVSGTTGLVVAELCTRLGAVMAPRLPETAFDCSVGCPLALTVNWNASSTASIPVPFGTKLVVTGL